MQKLKERLVRAPGLLLYAGLFAFLTGPAFGERGWMAALAALLLLCASLILGCAIRYGGNPRRLRSLALDRVSGCRTLAALLLCYLLCDGMNFTYSPYKSLMLERYLTVFCALALWAGIIYHIDRVDRLDNLLMVVTLGGLALCIPAVAGLPLENPDWAWRVIGAGLCTGALFLLSAQYNRVFKATVVAGLTALMAPSIYFAVRWSQPAALVESISPVQQQTLWSSAFSQLRDFGAAEMLFGRGAGYDLTLSGMRGVRNFLLCDLLGGGVVRFALSLSLWLCLGYCVAMLFLHCRGVALIYALVLGAVFVDAFFTAKTGYLSDPLFLLYTFLLIAEHTMLKKGHPRFAGG